ncbi:hypothetical protein roselon_03628 [Roseibacterium elongatum DSM 19469]|uniref:Hedgehog/Intein (Hint) domain-containing protein n=2 Tax=Roseicyclus elongatus TaxID=159346 RepID=W8S6G9_9RHOB|nr:hypothetical protein roselon_03628 [Roseibacterium elongatum DSM 19469]
MRPFCEAGNTPLACAACSASGLLSDNYVLTSRGTRRATEVRAGDEVMTFDDGFVPILGISKGYTFSSNVTCPMHIWPLSVPAGVLGNAAPVRVMPDNSVLFEYDGRSGLSFAVIPVRVLLGLAGVHSDDPTERQPSVHLETELPQLMAIDDGSYVLSHGSDILAQRPLDAVPVLSQTDARQLVTEVLG